MSSLSWGRNFGVPMLCLVYWSLWCRDVEVHGSLCLASAETSPNGYHQSNLQQHCYVHMEVSINCLYYVSLVSCPTPTLLAPSGYTHSEITSVYSRQFWTLLFILLVSRLRFGSTVSHPSFIRSYASLQINQLVLSRVSSAIRMRRSLVNYISNAFCCS